MRDSHLCAGWSSVRGVRPPPGRTSDRAGAPMYRSSIAAGAAASALFLVMTASPASAAPPVIDHWTDHVDHIEQVEHTDPPWCPDVPFDVRYVEDANGTFRFVRHGDGSYYGA